MGLSWTELDPAEITLLHSARDAGTTKEGLPPAVHARMRGQLQGLKMALEDLGPAARSALAGMDPYTDWGDDFAPTEKTFSMCDRLAENVELALEAFDDPKKFGRPVEHRFRFVVAALAKIWRARGLGDIHIGAHYNASTGSGPNAFNAFLADCLMNLFPHELKDEGVALAKARSALTALRNVDRTA